MALSAKNYDRPKLAQKLTENFTPIVALADNSNDTAILDIYANVNSANKVLCRVKVKVNVSGVNMAVTAQALVFPGTAATYSAGGTTPADAAAIAAQTTSEFPLASINLDSFYTEAGDARVNS